MCIAHSNANTDFGVVKAFEMYLTLCTHAVEEPNNGKGIHDFIQSEFFTSALSIRGPWSKQVIKRKESDKVCFDGSEYLTVSVGVSGSIKTHLSDKAFC